MKILIALFIGALILMSHPASAQTELMVNGEFESGTIAPWVAKGSPSAALNVLSAVGAHSGAQCLLLANGGFFSQDVYQTVTFPTNLIAATYSFYFDIVSTDPNPFPSTDATFSVYITDVNQNVLANFGTANNLNPTGGYVQFTTNLVTHTGSPNLSYAGTTVQVHFATATDIYGTFIQFYLDDVSMQVATTANIPANDEFTNLTVLTGFPVALFANNTFATKEPGEPSHAGNAGGHSLWWGWTAPTNGIVTINNFGSSFQTLLAVYTGSALANLMPVASSDKATATAVTFKAIAGTQYDIAVDGFNGATGNIVFNLAFAPDVTPPKVTITSPAAGANLTNASFLLQGKANDNVAVALVQYRLENAAGTNAYQVADGTTNWSATVANLIPGPNTVRVRAFDASSNISPTVARTFNYVVVEPLTLSISGGGTVSGVSNGQLLHVGAAYKITAKPKIGFGFAGWTGDIVTDSPALSFVMQTNLTLQANFLDIARPTLTITNPIKTGEKWSNAAFTVSGRSADNVAVSNVLVLLNGGDWAMAILTNDGSNWSEQVTLTPGTNTIVAYAVDTDGNVSKTNVVNLLYLLNTPLTLNINGDGTVKPITNNEQLAINLNYTMTAAPDKGFAFRYWSGGVTMSINPKLTFTMSSNLTINANFKDVAKPVSKITSPMANEKWTNSTITTTGKASDNVGVTGVWVQINNGGWVEAETINSFTNWNATNLTVLAGNNLLQEFAVDAAGNVSKTNDVKFMGDVAPTSLAGYEATLKPSTGKQELLMSWGDGTWAQSGTDNDTNANDYAAGSYTYIQTGSETALLTNLDIGMMSALGTTNVTTMNLTFTSATTANYAWTNENDSGSGTMKFSQVDNLVPASLGGDTLRIYKGKTLISTMVLANDGTFNSTNNSGSQYGTYVFTQYSPTVGILQSNFNDPNDAGNVQFMELIFASATAGQEFGSDYDNPTYGSNPDNGALGTFKIQ